MMDNILVAPSILSSDFSMLGEEVNKVIKAGADWIHVDVMDGHFVPNLTIGAPVVKSLRQVTQVPLDCHLMIENPEKYVEDFANAGADYITIHVEAASEPDKLLQEIRKMGVHAGITLKPATPIDDIEPYLNLVDLVLVMSVNPGFSGQKFMENAIDKISTLRKYLEKRNSSALIEVDGGINAETAPACIQAGAQVLVSGNFVFKNDYAKSIATLKGKSRL